MKKYETPVLEVIQFNELNRIMAGSPIPGNDADAKQNTIIFVEEDFVEEEDTTSIWNDPWKVKYSLWEDE